MLACIPYPLAGHHHYHACTRHGAAHMPASIDVVEHQSASNERSLYCLPFDWFVQGHYDDNCYHNHHTNNQHVPDDNNDGDDNYNVRNL